MVEPHPGDVFQAGQVVNSTFRIEGLLGRGGPSEVYLARNVINDAVVALKVLKRSVGASAATLDLMKREEEIRDITDDAVVRYRGLYRASDDGPVYLAMDYVEGPSLNDRLLAGGMSADELLVVARRVAQGLAACHRRGIVHRDLTPDNIILRGGAADAAVIIDFGIARDMSEGAQTVIGNDFAGKYEYAAPEQTEGDAEPRSDLYSLGAALLATYRGQVPFKGASPAAMIRRKSQPLDVGGIPDPLSGVIAWLAAPNPDDRPVSATEVVARLDAIHPDAAPTTVLPERATARPKPRANRRRLVAALLLVLGFGGGFWAWTSGVIPAGLMPTRLAVADPYTIQASADGRFFAHAPDEAAAAQLAEAYAGAAGAAPPASALQLAAGVPNERWVGVMTGLLALAGELEDWTFRAEGTAVTINGVAADRQARTRLSGAMAQIARAEDLEVVTDIAAGPVLLPVETVTTVLDSAASCGPLTVVPAPTDGFPLGTTLVISGSVADATDITRIRGLLEPLIGDRSIRIETDVFNEFICQIRAAIPTVPPGGMSITLAEGASGTPRPDGVFFPGETLLADVRLPAAEAGYLWVFVVDQTGDVFHLLPRNLREDHRLDQLGEVVDTTRRVPALFTTEEFASDPGKLALTFLEDTFGKSEIVAIRSDTPLFDPLRPTEESVPSFLRAIEDTGVGARTDIRAVATAVLEARP